MFAGLSFTPKAFLLSIALLAIPLFTYLFWSSSPQTLSLLDSYREIGSSVKQDFQSIPTLPLSEEKDSFTLTDNTSDGIDIQFANEDKTLQTNQSKLNLSFPKDYSKPIEVKLDDKRTIEITDLGGDKAYQTSTLGSDQVNQEQNPSFFQKLFPKKEKLPQTYLRYTSSDGRKSLLYAYQKEQSTGEKKLKHWTLYENGTGVEQESYQFKNAKVKVNQEGVAEVFYYTEQDLKSDQAAAGIDSNLMERAQRTLAKEMGDDLLNGNHTPDFTIPKPYFLDKGGEKHETEWKWNEETSTLSLSFSPESYPVALDPTLAFTAPGQSNTGSVIGGESTGNFFGWSLAAGDFNADGKTDLVVGAKSYAATFLGRVYIFYNDSAFPSLASGADITITGVGATDLFGLSLISGDFNADGKTDLAVGSFHTTAYIFYNDGAYPSDASGADVTITGEASSEFGNDMIAGDFNADGKTDLAVGAYNYSSATGRTYIFYNDGSIPTTAATADVIITGEATSSFGQSFAAGDFNADGKTDLAVGANSYSTSTGRAYIFYNDGSIPTTAATADVIITGETTSSSFGVMLTAGDFNVDGKTDVAIGASGYTGSTGRVYVFYGDGSIPTTAATADVIITGSGTPGYFGSSLTAGDVNADGRADLVVGATDFSNANGGAYIFYNDGSIPTTAATADVIILGENGSQFGGAVLTGDFNSDGKTDFVVSGAQYVSSTGRVYLFYSQNGQVNTNFSISGEATGDNFSESALATGDLNSDGRTDLIVGARAYGSSDTGRVYIFYGDGQLPTAAASADVIISSAGGTSDYFGHALATGDFDADGDTDLAVGADGYSTNTGRVYIFNNDGSYPGSASTADVTITGEATNNYFGFSLVAGNLNTSNNKTDLAVGAKGNGGNAGRVYIFRNDGSIPTTAATADVIIDHDGNTWQFGTALGVGDFNADGRTDLVAGAPVYSANTGRAYVFYNDGSYPSTHATADIIITGESSGGFGISFASGDFNADGRIDLAVGGYLASFNGGRAYIFYNDGSLPTTAVSADVIITGGAASDYLGYTLTVGDFNADGRTDIATAAYNYSSGTGRAYIFYNDDSFPTTAATADVTLTGDAASNYFGFALAAGDMNADGRTDLIVGAYGNTSSTGKVYLYETRENFAWQIQRQVGATPRTSLNGTGQEMKIAGEASSQFGYAMETGDLNSDGKQDLVVGAPQYSSTTGRTYIFYSDGSMPTGASSADVVITSSATTGLGSSLATGDFNSDGRIDLAIGAVNAGSGNGALYLFYNDGSFPITTATADVSIAGESSSALGNSLAVGDFNADGKTDIAAGGYYYSGTYTGRAYIFYNDGSYPSAGGSADVIVSGTTSNSSFGIALASGDFNADGKIDLAIGQRGATNGVYLYYNDGSIPTTDGTADVIITGPNMYFAVALAAGDFNSDGKTDLAVGSSEAAGTGVGKTYIFNNDGTYPATYSGADVTITGEATAAYFGSALESGDMNNDGRTDLIVGGYYQSTQTGRSYIFYNDGSIATAAGSADVILTGEATSSYYGFSLAAGDFNGDGRMDLASGAYVYNSNAGRVYVYTLGNDPLITGGATSDNFGYALTSGDFNADGKTDLAVGAYGYSTNTGRAYIFYNGSIVTEGASGADIILTGEGTSNAFGKALFGSDFNADSKVDLAVGAPDKTNTASADGRAYIFYNGSIVTESATGADVTITGSAVSGGNFGESFASADCNADGEADLIIGAGNSYAATGKIYVFYNDGSYPSSAGLSDITIDGEETSDGFGENVITGDFDGSGTLDIAAGSPGASSTAGRAYIFYNDGSIPTTAATADIIITNAESGALFGRGIASGDLNVDGRNDLIIGAKNSANYTGRAYIFYNDGSIPTTTATADVTITGEATGNYFGYALTSGDFNADGKTDLAVGAYGYSTNTGRAYIFASEVAAPNVSTEPAKTRGTIKARGTIKVR